MKQLLALSILLFSFASVAAEPVKIWISSVQDKQYYEEMVKRYQKIDPDFKAEVAAFGFMEMPDKLSVAMKTGIGTPDIVQLDEIVYSMFLRGPAPFLDIADRVKKADIAKDFHPQRLALFKQDDALYGLPQSISAYLIFYRKDLFEEFGISADDIQTWDDLKTLGSDLAAEGQKLMPLDPSYFEVLLRQRGGRLFDEEGKAFPDFDLAVDTLEYLKSLQDAKIAGMPDRGTIFDPVFFSGDVENNEVLAIIGADWYGLDMIQSFCPSLEGKWGIATLPKWTDKKTKKSFKSATFAGQGLMIYKGSKNVDKSWGFMEWVMTDKEANVARFVNRNSFPAYKPAWSDARLLATNQYFANESLGATILSVSEELPMINMNAKRGMAVFLMREKYFASIMMGYQKPAEALKELKKMLDNGGSMGGGEGPDDKGPQDK
ncbi:extracellular solute-binding protein [Lentisphaera profundi]|uniref:Extracellular solute-binding protein n=1 Tax=Lentisphaera profundi TaxID=1658616 RepID=A0ABY7VWA5_9BACT|nr:extracellular solute-binding protein [Lentisphaera profundi]WDE98508.1 extracellular solute-binding protein [Lentisphaera profundi]